MKLFWIILVIALVVGYAAMTILLCMVSGREARLEEENNNDNQTGN